MPDPIFAPMPDPTSAVSRCPEDLTPNGLGDRDRQYLYLHGFASGPQSRKAQCFVKRLAGLGIAVNVPDLNQGDFANLSLSRQIAQGTALLDRDRPATVIGSSFGGLTAAWLGERLPQIDRLVLLAPAFGFPGSWRSRLGDAALQRWQATGTLRVFHYGDRTERVLNYGFLEDGDRYAWQTLARPIPTLILHGKGDETVPISVSQDYSRDRPWVTLLELDSDHALTDSLDHLWTEARQFLGLGHGSNDRPH